MKKYFLYVFYVLVAGGLMYGLIRVILAGYSVPWTGFGEYTSATGDIAGGKKLWDWMELLIIPLVLAIGVFILNRSIQAIERQRANDRAELELEIAKDRQQEAALQAYLDRMSELLLEKKLRTTGEDEVRDAARTRTLTVLRGLDASRKGMVLQFLRDAGLIDKDKSVVELRGANLNYANLMSADLRDIDLGGTFLRNAYLGKAQLKGTSLKNADLTDADLSGVDLQGADLRSAYLRTGLVAAELMDANLSGVHLEKADLMFANMENANFEDAQMQGAILMRANLTNANLQGASLAGADLSGAKVSDEQLASAKSLKGATMPDRTIHE